MNTITFSKADFPTLKDCKVGEEEQLSVTIVPTSIEGDQVIADVTEATYNEPGEGTADEEAASDEEAEPAMSKKPARAIIAIGIPGKSSKGY